MYKTILITVFLSGGSIFLPSVLELFGIFSFLRTAVDSTQVKWQMYSSNAGTTTEKRVQSEKFYLQWELIYRVYFSSFYCICEIIGHLALLWWIPYLGLKKETCSQLFSYIRSNLEGLIHFGKDDLLGIATEIQSTKEK